MENSILKFLVPWMLKSPLTSVLKYIYFSATLLGVLRDVPGQPMVMMRCRERDAERLSLFPSLDYKGLYSTLLQFLDLVHLFQVCLLVSVRLWNFKDGGS